MCTNLELKVTRTIHPVGQGAFYTEVLHREGTEDKNVVYDCGLMPDYKIQRLYHEIHSKFPGNEDIDVLFISHFHDDHINGISELAKNRRIKYVVLPQIDKYDWFYVLEYFVATDTINVDLISDLRDTLKNSKLIQVSPAGDSDSAISYEDMAFENSGPRINGGSALSFGDETKKLWHYAVINPTFERDLTQLKTEIETIKHNGVNIKVIDLLDPAILNDYKAELRKKYENIFKKGNVYSMCVCSEIADRNIYHSLFHFSRYHKNINFAFFNKHSIIHDKEGCLYCGDADFNYKFKGKSTLDYLKKRLGIRNKHIGLLQIPHHGSLHNFNIDLYNLLCKPFVSFASYGTYNTYMHPSSYVMATAGIYGVSIGVDERAQSVLSEEVIVYS